jgi:putative hydrolase of HD superfamily
LKNTGRICAWGQIHIMDKVMKMCLFHDLGEAIAGDVPCFNKGSEDEENEEKAIAQILGMLDDELRAELEDLFNEMKEQKSKEARLFKALDMLKAVIQHNEAPIETWIPLEYELNKTYGSEEAKGIGILEELREIAKMDTISKINKCQDNKHLIKTCIIEGEEYDKQDYYKQDA